MNFEDKLERKLAEAEFRPPFPSKPSVLGGATVPAVSVRVDPSDRERVTRAIEQDPTVNFVRVNRRGEMTVYMSGNVSLSVAVDRVSQALAGLEADEPTEPRIEDPRWPGSSME